MTYTQKDLLRDLKAGLGRPVRDLIKGLGYAENKDQSGRLASLGLVAAKLGGSWVSTEAALDAFILARTSGPKEA